MLKKIMVHCSTNAGTSNFGDVLFAEMVLRHLQDNGFKASFFDLSNYVNKYLYETKGLRQEKISVQEADAVLYFAGGYFGEKKRERIDRSIRHYQRFMRFGRIALMYNKPIAVIGIGAGPALWYPSKRIVTKVCNESTIITTRDIESADFLKSIGVNSKIVVCSDIAQTYHLPIHHQIKGVVLDDTAEYIFLHTNYQKDVSELFALSVKAYISNHPNIKVLIGADNVVDISEAVEVAKTILGENRVMIYTYTEPDDLCAVLAKCKLILTYKLHVGIISATLGKSVIALAKHEKIQRYYDQIGEPHRCINFTGCTTKDVEEHVESYYGKGINLSPLIISRANQNWELLDNFLTTI